MINNGSLRLFTMDKIIHQIWIGPEAMPHTYNNIVRAPNLYSMTMNINSGITKIPQMPELCMVQFNRYGAMKKYAFQADILRYYLLNKYGGIYLDVDFMCNKRFDSLINREFFCVNPTEECFHVCNGILPAIQTIQY